MYRISLRAHQLQYAQLIPAEHRERFDAHYTYSKEREAAYAASIRQRLAIPRWHGWVAEMGGKVVGFTFSWREGRALILKRGLFVDPDFQGRGVGKALFEASAAIAKSGDVVRLKVVEENQRARRLYETHGFEAKGVAEETFYGAKQVVMERRVD